MKPIIKYRGGKSKEINNFIEFIPNQYDRYIEPFAGGAALLAGVTEFFDKIITWVKSMF